MLRRSNWIQTGVLALTLIASATAFAATERSAGGVSSASVSSVSSGAKSEPWVGIHFTGTTTGMGDQRLTLNGRTNYENLPIGLQLDIQPLHFLGVWGVGPSVEYFGIRSVGNKAPNLTLAWNIGAQARYQAMFSERQLVVPTIAYSVQQWRYQSAIGDGAFQSKGPTVGLWVFLNRIDSATAKSIYRDYGVSRTYLILERRMLQGQDERVSLSGHSYNLGLRMEI